MATIFLRFADRAEALSVLAATLSFDGMRGEDGRQAYSSGQLGEVHYHLCFLTDAGVVAGAGEEPVNLLWTDQITIPPALNAYVVAPASPRCVFAGADQLNL